MLFHGGGNIFFASEIVQNIRYVYILNIFTTLICIHAQARCQWDTIFYRAEPIASGLLEVPRNFTTQPNPLTIDLTSRLLCT